MPAALQNAFHPTTRAEWRRWLSRNHDRTVGVWLINYKKTSGKQRFDYDASVEEALCFGWIDSRPKPLDDERSALWFTPRKAGSAWSRSNKVRVERLVACGLMAVVGMAKVEAARRDGSWNALDAVDALEVPADLVRTFRKHPGAAANFEAFPRSVKRSILEWVRSAKKPETRARRVEETARLAAENIRANQWKKK
jgi:uncharacterized protein YdeI (YjbR/CyaY-like superfamily)